MGAVHHQFLNCPPVSESVVIDSSGGSPRSTVVDCGSPLFVPLQGNRPAPVNSPSRSFARELRLKRKKRRMDIGNDAVVVVQAPLID